MLLKITYPVKHVGLGLRYFYGRSTEIFPGKMAARKRGANDFGSETPSKRRKTVYSVPSASPSSSTSVSTSPTSVAGQIQRKYRRMQQKHSPLSTTAHRLLLRKLEGGNDASERGRCGAAGIPVASRAPKRRLRSSSGGGLQGIAVDCHFKVTYLGTYIISRLIRR